MTKDDLYLFFQLCPQVGPKTFEVILLGFNSLEKAYEAGEKQWLGLGFGEKLTEKIFKHKKGFNLKKEKEKLAKLEIKYISRENKNFPKLLKEISSCPIGLFVRGEIKEEDCNAVAVVGTRKITNYGREVTKKFSKALVENRITVVSGLARGVDGTAHRAALENGGRTIAVLGCGLEQIYPPEHKLLAQEIIKNGAVISEYPIGTSLAPGNFPARNRIVSGLSLGVLVTEGASKSGSKITATLALEQGRDVFAVPGPITNQMSQAPFDLIQMGAKLVKDENDILSELRLKNMKKNEENHFEKIEFEDEMEEKIWEFISSGNKHIDQICREFDKNASEISMKLTMMEMNGVIKGLGDGEYMVV